MAQSVNQNFSELGQREHRTYWLNSLTLSKHRIDFDRPMSSDQAAASPDQQISKGLRGSMLLAAGRVVSLGLNFLVQVAAVRFFTKEQYGLFAIAFSTVAVLSVGAAFGVDKAALRILPPLQNEDNRRRFADAIYSMLSLAVVTSIVTVSAMTLLLLTGVLQYEHSVSAQLLLILVWLIPCNVLDCLTTSFFSVYSRSGAIFLRQHLIGPVLKVAAVGVVVAIGGDIIAFSISQVIASMVGFILYLVMLRTLLRESLKGVPFRIQLLWKSLAEPIRFGFALACGDLAFLMRSAMVVLIIGLFFPPTEAANFQAVFPAARLNDLVITTFAMLFMPNAARIFSAGDLVSLQKLHSRTIIWTTVFSFPIFLVCLVFSSEVCVLLFGSAYADSGGVLALVSAGFFANAAMGMNLRILRVTTGPTTMVTVDAISLAIAFALNFAMIPLWGAWGGALAIFVGFIVQGLCCQIAVWRAVKISPYSWEVIQAYGLTTVLSLACLQLKLASVRTEVLLIAITLSVVGLLFYSRRQLELANVFPEIARTPILGRLFQT